VINSGRLNVKLSTSLDPHVFTSFISIRTGYLWQASFHIHACPEELLGCLQPRLVLVDGLVLPDLFMHLAQEFNSRMFFY
jgi:hypothetical protein